jgi:limonene 1,2-monooxygenase
MTRGRRRWVRAGALVSDAYMMGIEPSTQRQRMDEIARRDHGPVCGATAGHDEDRLVRAEPGAAPSGTVHPTPFPHFRGERAHAVRVTAAGKHGLGVRSARRGPAGGPEAIAEHWKIAEDTAAVHGKTMDR